MSQDIINYEEISREGLIDMLEEATERMTSAESRIQELEAALASKCETVCAYCREVFPSEDPAAILEHIKSCEKRPEKAIFETWERVQKMYENRILLLVNAAGRVVDMHLDDEDNAVWGETDIPVLEVPNEKNRDEAVKELRELLLEGPPNDEEEEKE